MVTKLGHGMHSLLLQQWQVNMWHIESKVITIVYNFSLNRSSQAQTHINIYGYGKVCICANYDYMLMYADLSVPLCNVT